MNTGLVGIVACGGRSRRMGKDKSMLEYHGKPQWVHLYEMLQPLCEKVFVSCNKVQATIIPSPYNILVDASEFAGIGPLASVLSAFEKFPTEAILVVGCDYPFVTKEHLNQLCEARTAWNDAICFTNPETNINEPLLAVYEKTAHPKLLQNFRLNKYSLRHFLSEADTCSIIPFSVDFLKSIDDNAGYENAKELLLSRLN